MRLYVKLEVDYPDNPRMIAAGEKAELLYIRALCLAKRTLSDGVIDARQIPRFGLAGWKARADKLVEVGLWEATEQGFLIIGWADRHAAAEEIRQLSEQRSEAGRRGGIRSGASRRGKQDGSKVLRSCLNTETETETETETKSIRDPEPGHVDVPDDFPEFWNLYPKRNDKKLGKATTGRLWSKLSHGDRAVALSAVTNYAEACDTALTISKDPERWLRGRCWVDWLEPAKVASSTRAVGGVLAGSVAFGDSYYGRSQR